MWEQIELYALYVALVAGVTVWQVRKARRRQPAGEWEVASLDYGEVTSVRWSQPDREGDYRYVAHYPATTWGCYETARLAQRLNEVDGSR